MDSQGMGGESDYDRYDSPMNKSSNQFQAIPDSEYKHLLDPYGIEMHYQQMVKKETQRELLQMQNRIKLLQIQEQKIKKLNDIRLKKVKDIVELRKKTKIEKEKREQRKLVEAQELAVKRMEFQQSKERIFRARMKSQMMYRT